MNTEKLIRVIHAIGEKIEAEKDYLTGLDNVIGDGDHGINMSRGFQEVEKTLNAYADKEPGDILKAVGMALVSKVGGSSGPLYGTAFLKMGMTLKGKKEISIEDFLKALQVAIDAVMLRGKAVRGEKTMLDAMIPAREAMESAYQEMVGTTFHAEKDSVVGTDSTKEKDSAVGTTFHKEAALAAKVILAAGVKAAWEGVEYTKTIAATKGRASYLGERSIGHQDPGATSFTMMLEALEGAL